MSAPNLIYPPSTGGGGGGVSGSGTSGTLPIWSGSTTLSNSAISQVGGCIATLTLTGGGTGGTNATYRGQALVNITGTGSGATADLIIASGAVTAIVVRAPGTGYAVGDTLTVTLGALAGAVFTVAAVNASDDATGNVTAKRIAAGTTSAPQGLSTNLGLTSSRSFWSANVSASTGTIFNGRQILLVTTEDEPGTAIQLPAAEGGAAAGVYANPRFDFSQRSTNAFAYSYLGQSVIATQNAAGSSFLYGASLSAFAVGSSLNGATGNLIGNISQASVFNSVTNPNTWTTVYAQDYNVTCTATAVQSISNAGFIVPRVPVIQGAAHVVTTWYGLWLPSITLAGGATIVNRYNVAQDDVNGKNNLRSKVFVGTALTATQQTAASLELEATNTVLSGSITNAGSGYTNGTYLNQTLTGAGTVAARANIVVSGGAVTSVTLVSGGEGYSVGNVLTAALPAGANFQWTVGSIQGNGDVRLRSTSATFDASFSSTNGLKLFSRGATGQTSSTLSWYEEGQYTPTFSAAWTPGVYTATWTRIGRKVFVTINFSAGSTNGTSGAATITVPAGLTPIRPGLGLRARPDGTASGNGVVGVDTAGLIQISTAITLDTNAKVIQCEYEV